MRKFKYIGNSSLEGPSYHFVIEVEEENFQNAKVSKCNLRGKVIEAGKNAKWEIGHYSNTWVNPFCSMLDYGFPVFILIE